MENLDKLTSSNNVKSSEVAIDCYNYTRSFLA